MQQQYILTLISQMTKALTNCFGIVHKIRDNNTHTPFFQATGKCINCGSALGLLIRCNFIKSTENMFQLNVCGSWLKVRFHTVIKYGETNSIPLTNKNPCNRRCKCACIFEFAHPG